MSDTPQPVRIEPLSDDWPAVLQQTLRRLPESQPLARILRRCLPMLTAGLLDARGIWVARAGINILNVQVCAPLAGAACLFWLPSGDDEWSDRLVQAGLDWA